MVKVLAAWLLLGFVQEFPGTKPAPRAGNWIKRHEGFVEEAKKGNVEVLFLGDSITDAWRRDPARKIWDQRFAPLKAANFGISGDCTQHVLWRIQNGELEGIAPKAVVLMIGTNNIGNEKQGTESVVEGIKAIVKEVHSRSANTRILLLGVFPRDEKPTPRRQQIKDVNAQISKLDDGGKSVKFLDIGDTFLAPDGTLPKETMPDFLHLSEKGYRLWADAIKGPLAEILKER